VWPRADGELSRFTDWLTLTHTHRWHAHRHSAGSGHVDQGRFKSFPVPKDDHFYTLCRYVERNAWRAHLVRRAEAGQRGSLHRWKHGSAEAKALLTAWPLPRWPGWVAHVNGPQTAAELAAARRSVQRGNPFGAPSWCEEMVRRLGLESTLRPPGRPKKHKNGS
jgi:putative transposase